MVQVADEDEMARDFVRAEIVSSEATLTTCVVQFGFLANLVRVFPSLKSRPLHLTGESYAGTYIVSGHAKCLGTRLLSGLFASHIS